MKLKVYHGNENYDFENGVVSVIIFIRLFLAISTFKKLFRFNCLKLSYFF